MSVALAATEQVRARAAALARRLARAAAMSRTRSPPLPSLPRN